MSENGHSEITVRHHLDTLSVAAVIGPGARARGWPLMVKKVLTWAGIAFLIFFVAYRPNSAADVFKSLGGGLVDIAQGFGEFVTNIVA